MRLAVWIVPAVALAMILSGCGPSSDDKARIRLAVSAFNRALDKQGRDEDSMIDLQKAVDLVPDGKARTEILRCQGLLITYSQRQRLLYLDLELNLLKIGHRQQSTKEDFERAMSKARSDNPLPDFDPLAKCNVISLPQLEK